MKRCICISCFDYYETRMKSIINYFVKKGYQTKYLYAGFDHFNKSENSNQYLEGIKVSVPSYERNLSIQRLCSHYLFSKKVISFMREYNPDIIYCMIPPNSLVKELANYKVAHSHIKLIFDCYDLWPESFPYHKFNKILRYPFLLWKNLRKKYIAMGDLIICVSQQGRALIKLECAETPVKVMRPVISEGELPAYNSDIETLTFCYLGMINHITDIELGVSILGQIAESHKTEVHIIGEGQNLKEFVEKLEAVNVKVFCHGCIFEMDKKNRIFSQCNFGLNIPREEIKSTMPLKAIEYMRAGLPFINSAKGDIQEIVSSDNIGYNIDRNDIQKTVSDLLALESEDLSQIHENCVKSYRNRFVAQNIQEIIGAVLEID